MEGIIRVFNAINHKQKSIIMAKYVVKARAGITDPDEQELDDWTEEDYRKYLDGDKEKEQEVRGVAHELVDLDFWVEKIEDEQ